MNNTPNRFQSMRKAASGIDLIGVVMGLGEGSPEPVWYHNYSTSNKKSCIDCGYLQQLNSEGYCVDCWIKICGDINGS